MDLQKRKIEFVQEFLKLQNEEIVSQLEEILEKKRKNFGQDELKPMTVEELNKRIDKSMEDSKKGRLTDSSKLKVEIEKWS